MPAISPVFERIYVAAQAEANVAVCLQKWFPTYLREVERQLGLQANTVDAPVQYTNRNTFDALPGESIPKVVVVSPGLDGSPSVAGRGLTRATWRIGVGVASAHKDEVTANLNSKIYGAAARAIILQNQGEIGGITQWVDESYGDLPIQNQILQYKAAQIWFTVDVENVVTKFNGPDVPDLTASEYAYGEVEHILIDLHKIAFNA